MKQARLLTDAEMKRVFAVVAAGRNAERNRMILRLGFGAGLRACSIAALKIGNVLNDVGNVKDDRTQPSADQSLSDLPEPRRRIYAGNSYESKAEDPDLARVITAWPDLPEHVRLAMLALVDTTR